MKCYYCDGVDGKHHPECPKPRPFYGVASAVLASLLLSCAPPQQVNWSPAPPWTHAPLTFDWSAIDSGYESSFTTGLEIWNRAAGCAVGAKVAAGAQADVGVAPYDGMICSSAAPTDLDTPNANAGFARCSVARGEIRFKVLDSLYNAETIWAHELGHAFGLAHDASTLMQPSPPLEDPAALGGGGVTLWLQPSDEDAAAVASRFCR